jgi:hypothetical protein
VSLLVILGVALVALGAYWLAGRGTRGELSAALTAVARGLEAGDIDAVMDRVSPYFYDSGVSRRRLREALEPILAPATFSGVTVVLRRWRVQDSRAFVSLSVTSTVPSLGSSRSEWRASLERLEGVWLVREARPVTVNGRSAPELMGLLLVGRRYFASRSSNAP